MYLKIIGSLFLMSSTAAIGFIKAEELNERVKNLMELKRMMGLLQGELRFRRAALPEAFWNVSERVEKPFEGFLKEVSDKLEKREPEGFDEIWNAACVRLLRNEGFQKTDGQLFEILGSSMGYLDLTMQMETIQLAMQQTEEAIEKAKEQQEQKGKLYRTMGVSLGALLTLLMV